MKKNTYTSTFLFFTFIFLLTSCKQNETTQKTTETVSTDSITVKTETSANTDTIINDTIKTDNMEKATNVPLRIVIDNLVNNDGEIEVSVYTPKNKFPDEHDRLKKYRFKPKNGKIDEMITDVPYGELAIATYHDENNSGSIDKNMIGIPKERYGFSNNFKPTIKAPSFDDCKFNYNKDENMVHISLLGKKS